MTAVEFFFYAIGMTALVMFAYRMIKLFDVFVDVLTSGKHPCDK